MQKSLTGANARRQNSTTNLSIPRKLPLYYLHGGDSGRPQVFPQVQVCPDLRSGRAMGNLALRPQVTPQVRPRHGTRGSGVMKHLGEKRQESTAL